MEEGQVYDRQKVKIWGSPWTNDFHGVHPKCKAFMLSEHELAKKWALIPDDVDILVTHSPPYGIFDQVRVRGVFSVEKQHESVGSKSLLQELENRIKPWLHVFGHI